MVKDVSPKLIQCVYFICKYKEASIIKTRLKSRQHLRLSADHGRSRIREFHKEAKVIFLPGTREQVWDVVNYFLGQKGQQALRNSARGLCELLISELGAMDCVIQAPLPEL
jgi:hypothetical protein